MSNNQIIGDQGSEKALHPNWIGIIFFSLSGIDHNVEAIIDAALNSMKYNYYIRWSSCQ